MDWRERITIDPGIMGGKPVVRGTRVPVQVIMGSLAGRMAEDEISPLVRRGFSSSKKRMNLLVGQRLRGIG